MLHKMSETTAQSHFAMHFFRRTCPSVIADGRSLLHLEPSRTIKTILDISRLWTRHS